MIIKQFKIVILYFTLCALGSTVNDNVAMRAQILQKSKQEQFFCKHPYSTPASQIDSLHIKLRYNFIKVQILNHVNACLMDIQDRPRVIAYHLGIV